MDDEEIKKPKGHEVGMMLDAMSVEELEERISVAGEAKSRGCAPPSTRARADAQGG
jgi:uncharacterized small protein (DUF1192 family)